MAALESHGLTKHEQLRKAVLRLARTHDGGSPIPSERALAETFGVARMTVRHAISDLVRDGVLQRVPGKGTFVKPAKVQLPLKLRSYTVEMLSRGSVPGARILAQSRVPANETLAFELRIDEGASVEMIRRLRTADGDPMAIETSYVPSSLAPNLHRLDLADGSLYATLAHTYEIHLDNGVQRIEAINLNEVDAALLDTSPGTAALLLSRHSAAGTQVAEFVESIYRADRYQLVTPVVAD